MTGGAVIVGVLCGLVIGVPLGLAIGAVFLRAACALYNFFAGGEKSPSSVPEPAFLKAMGIIFVTTLVNVVAGFGIGLVIGIGGLSIKFSQQQTALVAQLLSLPIGLLVMAGMNAALLPTSFGKGLLVALCHLLIVVVVAAVIIGGVVLVIFLIG